MQSAISADALLYPVAIGYRNAAGEVCEEAAYIDPSLWVSLQNILRQPRILVELTFSEPIVCGTKNRRQLARLVERSIANILSLPIPHKKTEELSDPPDE